MNNKINIFIIGNKPFYYPKCKYFTPILAGQTVSDKDYITDNTGENISYLNPYFCELTTHYWAWKNIDCEYYGFFHYRRYLSFNKNNKPKTSDRIYFESKIQSLTNNEIDKNGLNETAIDNFLHNYDVILPRKANLKKEKEKNRTVYNQYINNNFHDKNDLTIIENIIKRKYPNFIKYYQLVMESSETYFYNIFIMKKDVFKEYMNWLFEILFEFHNTKNYSKSSKTNMRSAGFISERLLTVYIEYLKNNHKNIRIGETQYFKIENSIDSTSNITERFKNKNVICLATSDFCSKYTSLTIISLLEKSHSFLNFLILLDNVSCVHKEMLNSIFQGKHNIAIEYINVASLLKQYNLKSLGRISTTTYSRLIIFDILKKSNKIVYLDSDIICNFDIVKLFNVDLKDKFIAAVRDTNYIGTCYNTNHKLSTIYYKNSLTNLGLKSINDYFNAGVLLIDIAKCKDISSLRLFELSESKDWLWLDQDVLNFVFKNKTKLLNNKFNYMVGNVWKGEIRNEEYLPYKLYKEYIEAQSNPYLIHYAGRKQPVYFNYPDYGPMFWRIARNSPFYEEILKESFLFKKERPFKSKLKTLFPYNSKTGKILRKIYWKFKK